MAVKASIPKGTRDFLPSVVRQRNQIMEIIRNTYELHGFDPIETPAIENIETLMGKYGEEGDQLLFKILQRGAKAASGACDLGLRYDLTVPLSRFVAMHQNEIPRIFKRYQMQPVYRADRPGHGRFREFYQCDVDIIGAEAPYPEIELISAIFDVFENLEFGKINLHLNDRRILRALIKTSGIAIEQETTAVMAIDKLDKIGVDGVKKELSDRGILPEQAEKLLDLLTLQDSNEATIARLETSFEGNEEAAKALAELRIIVDACAAMSENANVIVNPALARGLNYYTGAIFEIQADGLASSIAGGGRYDHLVGSFAGREIPAVGFSLGFERICVILQERGEAEKVSEEDSLRVMVACYSREMFNEGLKIADKIRNYAIPCELYSQLDKLAKQFKFANERGVSHVVIVGPEERDAGKVTIKDMRSGTQETVVLEDSELIRKHLEPVCSE